MTHYHGIVSKLVLVAAFLTSAMNVHAARTTILNADFNSNTNGFYYKDDIFGTHQPHYAMGNRWRAGGGSLGVWLGGQDDREIWDMSGGWIRHIHIPQHTTNAWIKLQYHVTLSADMDSGEQVTVKYGLNGMGAGYKFSTSKARSFGASNSHVQQSFGLISAQIDIRAIRAGKYELFLGAFLNSKNSRMEKADIWFDNVSVAVEVKAPVAVAPPNRNAVLLHTGFSKNASGFQYKDDAFRGTRQPRYSSGRRIGRHGGSLGMWLGGQDNHNIWDMSGAWSRHIRVPRNAKNVWIVFSYYATLSADLDQGEFAQVLGRFGHKHLGNNGVIGTFYADDRHVAQGSGKRVFRADIGHINAGNYDLVIGGFLNSKQTRKEFVDIVFDDVKVSVAYY